MIGSGCLCCVCGLGSVVAVCGTVLEEYLRGWEVDPEHPAVPASDALARQQEQHTSFLFLFGQDDQRLSSESCRRSVEFVAARLPEAKILSRTFPRGHQMINGCVPSTAM